MARRSVSLAPLISDLNQNLATLPGIENGFRLFGKSQENANKSNVYKGFVHVSIASLAACRDAILTQNMSGIVGNFTLPGFPLRSS